MRIFAVGWSNTRFFGSDSGTSVLARIIHHSRGASLALRYHSAFASLTNTTSIRSVTENTVITNTCAIHPLSGELSRLARITSYYFLLIIRFFLLSFFSLLVFLVEPTLGTAQQVVRVRSETRIELFVSRTSQPSKITGTLRDSLGIPLPNHRIEVATTWSTDRKSRTVVTTGSNGTFTVPVPIKRREYNVRVRFDGNAFYEATETTLKPDGIDSSARFQPTPSKNAVAARESHPDERHTEDSEPLSVLWLLIPIFLCFAIVVAIKRRLLDQKPKFDPENEFPTNPGIEISLPVRHARKDRSSISGTIRDLHSGDAVRNVELVLVHKLDTSIALDISSEGFFSSPNLSPGKWQIRARAYGYVETTKDFSIPHRGEWTNVRINLQSLRSLALQSYRAVALALLPTPQLWDIWTARETLHKSRKLLGSLSLFRSLVERVERSSYCRTPPTCEEVNTIATQASSVLETISRSETDLSVTRRR